MGGLDNFSDMGVAALQASLCCPCSPTSPPGGGKVAATVQPEKSTLRSDSSNQSLGIVPY